MTSQDEVIARFRSLFVCRDDGYHRHDGKKWERVTGPLTDEVVLAHLTRRECIALAPAKQFTLTWAAIDFRAQVVATKKTVQDDVQATLDQLDHHCIAGHIVESGRGYQLWVFLEEACSAKATEVLLEKLKQGEHQVYAAKQPVRLPLGLDHEHPEVFCCFVDREFEPVRDQRDYLVNAITPSSPNVLQAACSAIEEQ